MNKQVFHILLFIIGINMSSAQIGIGTTTPHPSSDLELGSPNKVLLLNRVEVDDDNAPILSDGPENGMMVYDNSNQCIRVFENGEWSNCLSRKPLLPPTSNPPLPGDFVCGDPVKGKVSFNYGSQMVTYGSILSSSGHCWLDCNLGAFRAAISTEDPYAYGDLFQWGREADGHQSRHSNTTTTFSLTDSPGHADFILVDVANLPLDWRMTPNNNLWQGVSGTNNPCPGGFRIPSEEEFQDEIDSGAPFSFISELKLVHSGLRDAQTADISYPLDYGTYWTSETMSTNAWGPTIDASKGLYLSDGNGTMFVDLSRAFGLSVRCIKDGNANGGSQIGNIFTSSAPIYTGSILEGGVGYYDESLSGTITVKVNVQELGAYELSGELEIIKETNRTDLDFTIPDISPQTLKYTASGNFTTTGVQDVVFTPEALTPKFYGEYTLTLSGNGVTNAKTIKPRIDIKTLPAVDTQLVDITSPYNRQWMDRSLGAHRAALGTKDPLSYGSLFQWGRFADGHELIVYHGNSLEANLSKGFYGTTSTLSSSDNPNHQLFITASGGNPNWRSPDNPNLWQEGTELNNPCPSGYRIPTSFEWDDEFIALEALSKRDMEGLFDSMKLSSTALRLHTGPLHSTIFGDHGFYWTVLQVTDITPAQAQFALAHRAMGASVRCMKK